MSDTIWQQLQARANRQESLDLEVDLKPVESIELNRRAFLQVRHGPPYVYVWNTVHTPEPVPTPFLEMVVNMDSNGRTSPTERLTFDREQVKALRAELDKFLEWSKDWDAGSHDTTPEGGIN